MISESVKLMDDLFKILPGFDLARRQVYAVHLPPSLKVSPFPSVRGTGGWAEKLHLDSDCLNY